MSQGRVRWRAAGRGPIGRSSPAWSAAAVAALFAVVVGSPAVASDACGVVSHIGVVSDRVPDVSGVAAWRRSYLRDGMSDADKAMAVWTTIVAFGLEGAPVAERLSSAEPCVHDPIKTFNVYGCNNCCCATAMAEALDREAGLTVRGWTLRGHCVPEFRYDGAWHMLDPAYVDYFVRPDGAIAGVEEIAATAQAWYAAHPECRGDDARLQALMRDGGWRSAGPALLAACPTFDAEGRSRRLAYGGWATAMANYDGGAGTPFLYDQGSSQGYELNIQLRRGERLVRCWSNRGRALPLPDGLDPAFLDLRVGAGVLSASPAEGDLANGRIGHGRREYDVPLADGGFRAGALAADDLVCTADDRATPALRARDPAAPASLVLRMPSSYPFLTGAVAIDAVVGAGGAIAPAVSLDHGATWIDLPPITASGAATVDVGALVRGRYDYRLRLTLSGAGTGLDRLAIAHDVLQSQRALPALGQGANRIACAVGPAEGTITIAGAPDPAVTGAPRADDFHPVYDGVAPRSWRLIGGAGTVTFPVVVPGDLLRLRLACDYRARDAADGWDYQVSFDGGRSFRTIARAAGPTAGDCSSVAFDEIPPGTRSAVVRWAGTQRNTTCVFRFSIDADYREPAGGFAPVLIAYDWDEDGRPRHAEHVARSADDAWDIACAGRPTMRSITLSLADPR